MMIVVNVKNRLLAEPLDLLMELKFLLIPVRTVQSLSLGQRISF